MIEVARRSTWGDVREVAGLVVVGLTGGALFVYVVVADIGFVANVYERSEAATAVAVGIAAVAALATVLGVVAFRNRAGRRLGRLAIAWCVLFVIAFFWTHPKSREDHLGLPLHAGVVTYLLLILVTAVAFLPLAMARLRR